MRFEYAVHRASGQVMHVDDVPNGKQCECICKNCGDPLLAKNKGKIIGHHFSHTTKEESRYCRMTQLHMAMQVYFSTRAEITLPGDRCSVLGSIILMPALKTSVLQAGIEYRVGPYSADTVLETTEGRVLIEVCVTHGCEDEKVDYYRSNKIDCIEYFFPLNAGKSIDEWIEAVENNEAEFKWLYHSAMESAKEAHLEEVENHKRQEMAARRTKSLRSLKKCISEKKIFLPDIYCELTETRGEITFTEKILLRSRKNILCDEMRLVAEFAGYVLAEATLNGRYLSIIYAFSDDIPVIETAGERSIICRYYPQGDNKPLWIWLQPPPMEQKIAREREAFSLRCKQQMQQRETLIYVKYKVERLSADYEENRDSLFKRHYGEWKRWMIQKKLFLPLEEKKNPSIPAVLKLKRDYACLWPFNAWDVLVISSLAEELDSYPLNYPVSYTRLFSGLEARFGVTAEFQQLSEEYQTLKTPTTYDALIDVNEIIRSTLFPFYNMHVVTMKKFSVVRTASLTALLRLEVC